MKLISTIIFTSLLTNMCYAAHVGPDSIYPNPKLTPGKANPVLTQELICSKSFRTGVYRNVPQSEKKKIAKNYGINYEATRKHVEYDHFVSLELGGSNDIANIWPEAYSPQPGAHEKDMVENYLHKAVCAGRISLEEAQKEIVDDWYAVYLKIK
jgi:hypothetical protein